MDDHRKMFESRSSAGATEKYQVGKTLANYMDGHAKKCVERYCEMANKKTEQLYKVSTAWLDDHHLKKEELESVGELSKVCSLIVLKFVYLAQMLDQSRMDKSLWQPLSSFDFLNTPHEWLQACHVGNTAKQCRLALFQDSYFAGDLEDSKSTSGGLLCQSTNVNTKSKRHGNREFDELSNVHHVVTSAELSHFEAQLYIFDRQRSSDQDDHKGKKSDDETGVQNPQSCAGLVVWQDQVGPTIPKFRSGTSTPNISSQTCWQIVISRVMSGIFFFFCSTSWISRCFLAAIFSTEKPSTMSKRAQERRTKEEPVVSKSRSERKSTLPLVGFKSWVGILFSQALGNECGSPESSNEFSWVAFSSIGKPVGGIENQLARKKLDYHNMQIPDNTLRKSSRTFDRSWIVRRMNRYLIKRPMYWSGDY